MRPFLIVLILTLSVVRVLVLTVVVYFLDSLPYSIRVLLESAVRNCDQFKVTEQDVERILAWGAPGIRSCRRPFSCDF